MSTNDERLERMEGKLDGIGEKFDDFRVSVEHRLTKAEERAGIYGAITGLLSSLGLAYFKGKAGP